MVLPKAMRWGATPRPRQRSISPREAQSNWPPRAASGRDDLGGGVGLDRVVDGRVAEAAVEGAVLGAQHVEVEDDRRAVELGRADEGILRAPRRRWSRGGCRRVRAGSPAKAAAYRMRISISPGGSEPRSSQKRRYRRYVSSPRWGTLQRRVRWRRKGAYEASGRRNQAETVPGHEIFRRARPNGAGGVKVPLSHNHNRDVEGLRVPAGPRPTHPKRRRVLCSGDGAARLRSLSPRRRPRHAHPRRRPGSRRPAGARRPRRLGREPRPHRRRRRTSSPAPGPAPSSRRAT